MQEAGGWPDGHGWAMALLSLLGGVEVGVG